LAYVIMPIGKMTERSLSVQQNPQCYRTGDFYSFFGKVA
jgi:hypothetical protein